MPKRSGLRTLLSLYRGGTKILYYGVNLRTQKFFTGYISKKREEEAAVALEEAIEDCDFEEDTIFEYYNEKLLALRV